MRSGGGSSSGVYFLASLELAQQCEAFIGHGSSSVPSMFFDSMCLQHQVDGVLLQGVCPVSLDIRDKWIPEN